jgi:hypothetical protein
MRRALALGLASAALSGIAAATVVVRLDLRRLVSEAEAIFEGRCLATRPVLDGAGRIATAIRVGVVRAWKGAAAGGEVEFVIPGGEMGELGLAIPGMPTFSPGEDLLLFLSPASVASGVRMPVGLGQGKFAVERDPRGGGRRLVRSLGGLDLVDPDTGAPLTSPGEERFDYEALTAAIGRLVR